MSKKIGIKKILLLSIVTIVLVIGIILIIMGNATSPSYLNQTVVLSEIRDCIWYGFEGNRTYRGIREEKETIILPESLLVFTPITEHFELKELGSLSDNCNLIYNPNGHENKTWIAVYNADNFESCLMGSYVLWSDKQIKRKRGIMKEAKKLKSLKYYSVRR